MDVLWGGIWLECVNGVEVDFNNTDNIAQKPEELRTNVNSTPTLHDVKNIFTKPFASHAEGIASRSKNKEAILPGAISSSVIYSKTEYVDFRERAAAFVRDSRIRANRTQRRELAGTTATSPGRCHSIFRVNGVALPFLFSRPLLEANVMDRGVKSVFCKNFPICPYFRQFIAQYRFPILTITEGCTVGEFRLSNYVIYESSRSSVPSIAMLCVRKDLISTMMSA